MIFDILRKESKKTKGVCLLKLNYKPVISIGRGSSSDIRMNDISVSRNHALLRLTPQGLFLEDNISKFGTLVLVKEPFPILKTRNNVYMQVGRTVIQANVKANWKYVMKHSKYIEKNLNEYKLKHNFFKQNNLVRATDQTEEDNIIEIADSEDDDNDEEEDDQEDLPNNPPNGLNQPPANELGNSDQPAAREGNSPANLDALVQPIEPIPVVVQARQAENSSPARMDVPRVSVSSAGRQEAAGVPQQDPAENQSRLQALNTHEENSQLHNMHTIADGVQPPPQRDTRDIFSVREDHEAGLDRPQDEHMRGSSLSITRFDSQNANAALHPHLSDRQPMEEDGLQQGLTGRRENKLGTINSAKSEEEKN